jgi:putative transposase
VFQNVLRRLDRACENFFRRVKAGDGKAGYPRFSGRGRYDSFRYPQWGHGAKLAGGRLVLSKVGGIGVCADCPLAGTPKTCQLVRKADGWYAHIACETEDAPLLATGEGVGVDGGIAHFATLSNAETIANPRHYRAAERRLRQARRRVLRRVKGSKRRAKARAVPAKAHLHVWRRRRDSHHQAALTLVRRFEVIAVEDLHIRGMLKQHALAKHIQDAGRGQFRTILSQKAESAAKTVVAVDPGGTSQTCIDCGSRAPKQLSDRWHSCPFCGCEMDRDHHAARNIKHRGAPRSGSRLRWQRRCTENPTPLRGGSVSTPSRTCQFHPRRRRRPSPVSNVRGCRAGSTRRLPSAPNTRACAISPSPTA